MASSAWSRKKRLAFESAFYEFLNNTYIDSKDSGGHMCLGENIFEGQRRFITSVLDGLEQDIHDVYVLKSRQLGLSTISRALSTFYLGVTNGLRGALVFDTEGNKSEARLEIVSLINELPSNIRFPKIVSNNRGGIQLENNTTLAFMSAGVKKSKSSGTLGRSRGLSFIHASEMCSWENPEGVESLRQSLSDINPDRLYIWESTGRGFNQWYQMWQEAREDPAHKKCIFLGFWAKDSQKIARDEPDFERYGVNEPTEKEQKKIDEVKKLYNFDISREQLAWVRRKMDPAGKGDDYDADLDTNVIRLQEQPWTETDAWQITGSTFFEPENLNRIVNKDVSRKFKSYSYFAGAEFYDCQVVPAFNSKMTQLKVWEEPQEDAVYVVAADPAFGHDDRNDRSAIQVLRCYADGLDQVAEYAWPLINSRQFAWVIASLLGWYAGDSSQVYFILEMNGPGEAVWNEFMSLKAQVQFGYHQQQMRERGLESIFNNVKNYIYTRSDSMSVGRNYQWVLSTKLKVTIMQRLRDFTSNEMLAIRSQETIEEMRSIAQEGDSIAAQGSKKDDRIIALAMGVRCWEERVRRGLLSGKRTRESELAKKQMSLGDQIKLFNSSQFSDFFAVKAANRRADAILAMRQKWKNRR
jgi:hypothetical protein